MSRFKYDTEEALRLYLGDEGASASSVARQLGVTAGMVCYLLKSRGIPLRNSRQFNAGRPRGFDYDEAIRLYVEEDKSLHEIAKLLGVSRPGIRYAFKLEGVTLRSSDNLRQKYFAGDNCQGCLLRPMLDDHNGLCLTCKRIKGYFLSVKNKHGLSSAEFHAILKAQNGLCGICDSQLLTLTVDHCHKTGKVRGILCSACNSSVGKLGDSSQGVMRAVRYLERAEVND